MVKNFFVFLSKVTFGRYDELVWEDILHFSVLIVLIMAFFHIFL